MMEQPSVSDLVEAIETVERLQKELSILPADAQSDRAILLNSLGELRTMIRKFVN